MRQKVTITFSIFIYKKKYTNYEIMTGILPLIKTNQKLFLFNFHHILLSSTKNNLSRERNNILVED